MQTTKEKASITVGGKILAISYRQFDDELDVDEVLQIDINRLAAEALTFPVLMNRLGLLLADAEDVVREKELDLEIWMAKRREAIREELIEQKQGGIKLTQDDMKYTQEAMLKTDPMFKAKHKIASEAKKRRDYISSIFWSAKDKSGKIELLLNSVKNHRTLEELMDEGALEGKINGIRIKMGEQLFKD